MRNREIFGSRVVELHGEIDDAAANRVVAQLLRFAAEEPRRDIHLFIESPGGSVTAGTAVYDAMTLVPCDVATYTFGLAGGMAQFLLSAGAPDKRITVRGARIVMRGPSFPRSDAHVDARLVRVRHTLSELMAARIGHSPWRIRRDWDAERDFTAEEARAYGLVDRVHDHPPGV
ncbi:ATP-dependent Clp protease proteolytic subunit 1 [Streptomyces sp. RB5]|uniref:ATP-dependent Clp protease proteolytic subunit n=1 Tax=Streptomyces smaragdinus TaxID=2585196 RepID=A0A7K0CG57_9ACTN|nr:ATP-dependent Clp protease proteolytic subunit [Streptomyces smaragdinus]MQY12459.1 ATP-dependent Clp protease proteolytic subunit 1 [Streptomyces smaragdinus]